MAARSGSTDGRVVGRCRRTASPARGVGRTFQTPECCPSSACSTMRCSAPSRRARRARLAAALRLPRARREQAASLGDALRYLDFVGLADARCEPAGELPHGQQRLAEIARALVGRPRLLLLDEPAAGLSLAELDRLGELIARDRRAGHDRGDRRAPSRAGRQYLPPASPCWSAARCWPRARRPRCSPTRRSSRPTWARRPASGRRRRERRRDPCCR